MDYFNSKYKEKQLVRILVPL